MNEERKKLLLDATAGIREEYIEEAAAPRPRKQPLWMKLTAAAAVLALVIGGLLLKPTAGPEDPARLLFAVQAYAADGTPVSLNAAPGIRELRTGTSEMFPDKETFTLDIILMEGSGAWQDLKQSEFSCTHRFGTNLKPGESDDSISISWIEEGDLFGYRITGWCEKLVSLDITIKWKDGLILHQSSILIQKDGDYQAKVYTFYNFEAGLSTKELIAKIFDTEQDYFWHTKYASTLDVSYSALVRFCGGFAELEQRSDAASLLLERWVQEVEASEHRYASVEGSGLTGLVLYQDAHWNNLTEEELALIESYGYSTEHPEKGNPFFPGKKTFVYDVILAGENTSGNTMTATYKGQAKQGNDEHLLTAFVVSTYMTDSPFYGWRIRGWFDKPTFLTLTVTDRNGKRIQRDVILIIPTEDGYKIKTVL